MEWLGINRRRLGTGMLVFGLAGMVMAAIVAVALVLGAFAARDLDERLEADQARIAASLTRLSVTMDSLAITTQNAGTTLQTSSETLLEAGQVLESASTSLVSLAEALDVTILGNRPFAKASENLAELARTIGGFEGQATTLALNLHQNSTDVAVMTDQIRQLKTQVNELASRITGFDRIGEMVGLLIGGIVLAALLTAWVGIAAAFCAWVGWKLRRIGRGDGSTVVEGASAAG
ncbi:MAG TPA: hypothetical protein VES19_03340 [Candidatus Limnocylindrales bacterium]|nr:hypothetical protein [Candidatus Limnocylindrales bacterium]